jgi:hypothetical protein
LARDEALTVIHERLMDLVEALETYRARLEGEQARASDNTGLQRLLGVQLKRVGRMLDYLDQDGEETLRDLMDRDYVVNEARHGRFV